MTTKIIMDGITYRVRIVYDSMERAFELMEGDNAGDMLSGRYERDLLGTKYGYTMQVEPDPALPEEYDAFFEAVSAPVDSHRIILPYGQSTLEYTAMIRQGQDVWGGRLGGKNRWHGLTLAYEPQKLQRRVF